MDSSVELLVTEFTKNTCLVAPDLLKIVRVLSDVLAVSKLEIQERKK